MKRIMGLVLAALVSLASAGQKLETVYLNFHDSTANMSLAVIPENKPIKAFLFFIGWFRRQFPNALLAETQLPVSTARQGILVIIPVLNQTSLFRIG